MGAALLAHFSVFDTATLTLTVQMGLRNVDNQLDSIKADLGIDQGGKPISNLEDRDDIGWTWLVTGVFQRQRGPICHDSKGGGSKESLRRYPMHQCQCLLGQGSCRDV